MSTNTESHPDPQPAPPAGQAWPTVIGVLCLVLGVRSFVLRTWVVQNLCGGWQGLADYGGAGFSRLDLLYCLYAPAVLVTMLGGCALLLRRRCAAPMLVIAALATLGAVIWSWRTDWNPGHLVTFKSGSMTIHGRWLIYASAQPFPGLPGFLLGVCVPLFLLAWFACPSIWHDMNQWKTRDGRLASRSGPLPWAATIGLLSMVLAVLWLVPSVQRIPSLLDSWTQYRVPIDRATLIPGMVEPLADGLLLLSGYLLLRKKSAGWTGHIMYAIFAITLALAGLILPLLIPGGMQFMTWEQLQYLAGEFVKGDLYPTFLLVWMLWPSVRREVKQWP